VETKDLAGRLRERLSILLDISPEEVGDETPFADLGVDSMMRLELVALVEQHIGFELPERDLGALSTMRDVDRYVLALEPR
jgi:acyl carrier protein